MSILVVRTRYQGRDGRLGTMLAQSSQHTLGLWDPVAQNVDNFRYPKTSRTFLSFSTLGEPNNQEKHQRYSCSGLDAPIV